MAPELKSVKADAPPSVVEEFVSPVSPTKNVDDGNVTSLFDPSIISIATETVTPDVSIVNSDVLISNHADSGNATVGSKIQATILGRYVKDFMDFFKEGCVRKLSRFDHSLNISGGFQRAKHEYKILFESKTLVESVIVLDIDMPFHVFDFTPFAEVSNLVANFGYCFDLTRHLIAYSDPIVDYGKKRISVELEDERLDVSNYNIRNSNSEISVARVTTESDIIKKYLNDISEDQEIDPEMIAEFYQNLTPTQDSTAKTAISCTDDTDMGFLGDHMADSPPLKNKIATSGGEESVKSNAHKRIPLVSALPQNNNSLQEIQVVSNNGQFTVTCGLNYRHTTIVFAGKSWVNFVIAHKLLTYYAMYITVQEPGLLQVLIFDRDHNLINNSVPQLAWDNFKDIKDRMIIPRMFSEILMEDHVVNHSDSSFWSIDYGEYASTIDIDYEEGTSDSKIVLAGTEWKKLFSDHEDNLRKQHVQL
ncbi:OLC1v1031705C1 [Oldenlandia corymbosa var. corymbosa]|uniref:OLC1v1031705C1 n=1 Tax=Oldenlandia corymbosa var. corymbosa TaxID=529605 RepID=A0AAV1CM22_OLDCO|nr:OLC1v1031705C1 [Oldenlandia corymbosa var. corymbosa]